MRTWIRENGIRLSALALVALLFALPVAALMWMTAVPGTSWRGALPPPTPEERDLAGRLRGHVVAIAGAPRNIGHPEAFAAAAAYIERTLAGQGHAVLRQPFDDGHAVNLEAVIEPACPKAPTLVVGAHYDSAFTAPGANDNGSGTAALLELARLLADLRGRANVRIRLAFFANEEPAFFKTDRMGSLVYALALVEQGQKPDAMFSLFYRDEHGSQYYPFPLAQLYPDSRHRFGAAAGAAGDGGVPRRCALPERRGHRAGLRAGDRLVGSLGVRRDRRARADDHRHRAVPLSALSHARGYARQDRLWAARPGHRGAGPDAARLALRLASPDATWCIAFVMRMEKGHR
ncbi:hypothetical protein CAP40_10625 [Sphingomonas sp. IBVSS2]|nr:M28 family peptidase [Sphingomonas sp. IBVSS2]OSZ66342.1 hypothetical protein CAP40_10625 [Sphingomonas sp. IBVSS2]